jgi:PTS system nitrogen regulatory IIA component
MNLLDYTMETGFLPQIKCDTVRQAVEALVQPLVGQAGLHTDAGLVDEILRREDEGSTAIGGGLLIPHARFSEFQDVHITVATLKHPLEIPAEDSRPVDVVILLVGPLGDPRAMLRVLARLARLVKQDGFLDGLRSATTDQDLKEAFARLDLP